MRIFKIKEASFFKWKSVKKILCICLLIVISVLSVDHASISYSSTSAILPGMNVYGHVQGLNGFNYRILRIPEVYYGQDNCYYYWKANPAYWHISFIDTYYTTKFNLLNAKQGNNIFCTPWRNCFLVFECLGDSERWMPKLFFKLTKLLPDLKYVVLYENAFENGKLDMLINSSRENNFRIVEKSPTDIILFEAPDAMPYSSYYSEKPPLFVSSGNWRLTLYELASIRDNLRGDFYAFTYDPFTDLNGRLLQKLQKENENATLLLSNTNIDNFLIEYYAENYQTIKYYPVRTFNINGSYSYTEWEQPVKDLWGVHIEEGSPFTASSTIYLDGNSSLFLRLYRSPFTKKGKIVVALTSHTKQYAKEIIIDGGLGWDFIPLGEYPRGRYNMMIYAENVSVTLDGIFSLSTDRFFEIKNHILNGIKSHYTLGWIFEAEGYKSKSGNVFPTSYFVESVGDISYVTLGMAGNGSVNYGEIYLQPGYYNVFLKALKMGSNQIAHYGSRGNLSIEIMSDDQLLRLALPSTELTSNVPECLESTVLNAQLFVDRAGYYNISLINEGGNNDVDLLAIIPAEDFFRKITPIPSISHKLSDKIILINCRKGFYLFVHTYIKEHLLMSPNSDLFVSNIMFTAVYKERDDPPLIYIELDRNYRDAIDTSIFYTANVASILLTLTIVIFLLKRGRKLLK